MIDFINPADHDARVLERMDAAREALRAALDAYEGVLVDAATVLQSPTEKQSAHDSIVQLGSARRVLWMDR